MASVVFQAGKVEQAMYLNPTLLDQNVQGFKSLLHWNAEIGTVKKNKCQYDPFVIAAGFCHIHPGYDIWKGPNHWAPAPSD